MIEVVDLYKSFNNHEVLRGVNLKVEEGQTLALIGGSGKGKSVLLKLIIGLTKPDRGKILINNQDISKLRGKLLKQLKQRCGIVFQGGALFDSLTVFDNVAFPLREKTRMKDSQIRDTALAELARGPLRRWKQISCRDKRRHEKTSCPCTLPGYETRNSPF